MNNGYIALDYTDLAIASVFLFLNGAISLALGLGIERRLAIAAFRMIVQLTLVGLLLKTLFALASPWLTLAVASAMLLFAGHEVRARQQNRLAGIWGHVIGTGAMSFAGSLVILLALLVLLRPEPWWTPRYALPLFGMILGNTMTGTSLALDTLHRTILRERRAIEARLLLGASRWQAARPFLRTSLRTGFMPIVNAMAATGIVSLPGMMTGQILSGVDPEEAVKYQIMVMFLIGGSTGLGVLLATIGSFLRLTDERHRLRPERLIPQREDR